MINIISNIIGVGKRASSVSVVVTHFVVIGQSQAGAYNSVPALTTVSAAGVRTLTSGPLDVNTSGSLIPLVEGDTFSDTGGPAPTANVETIATSMAQQLKLWYGTNKEYVVTIHASGGRTIQALTEGGASGQYEEAFLAIARVKSLVEAEGKTYNCHLIFFHGGDGGTTYEQAVQDLYSSFLADVKPAYTTQTNVYMFTHQQRPIGSPDYGIAQWNASKIQTNIIVVGPEYKSTYQGDAIHLTNHGERYLAMIWARAIYKKLSASFLPLELDIANSTFDGATKITIPVLNAVGALGKTTNAGIQVFSNTTSAVLASTTAINGTNIEITITASPLPIGSHILEIRSGIAANGELHDSSSAVDIPSFNALDGNPYNLDKYLVRALHAKTVFFPVNMLLNFGGSDADPVVSGTYSVWDNARNAVSNVLYPISGNVKVTALNDATNYWGFTNPGTAFKGGNQTVTGTNFFHNDILDTYWFTETKLGRLMVEGLNPLKTYKIIWIALRSGTAGSRQSAVTINGVTVTKTSNRAGTAGILTTEAECIVFTGIAPNGSGQISMSLDDNNPDATTFAYLNGLQFIEQ